MPRKLMCITLDDKAEGNAEKQKKKHPHIRI